MINPFDVGFIKVSGEDAASFLQGQLTNDIQQVNQHHSQLTAYCNHQGRIQASLRVIKWQDVYLLQVAKELLTTLLQQLQTYVLRSKVNLQDVSDEFKGFILTPPEVNLKDLTLPQQVNQVTATADLLCIKSWGSCYELIATDSFAPALQKLSTPDNVWELAALQAGFVSISKHNAGLFTPHDLNYPQLGLVNFKKGCYRGQEIIARMEYRGKLKQHLYQAKIAQTILPQAGTAISHAANPQQVVGTVAASVRLDAHTSLLLAVMADDAINEALVVAGELTAGLVLKAITLK